MAGSLNSLVTALEYHNISLMILEEKEIKEVPLSCAPRSQKYSIKVNSMDNLKEAEGLSFPGFITQLQSQPQSHLITLFIMSPW